MIQYADLKAKEEFCKFDSPVGEFKIDSREIKQNDVFVALKGRFSNGEDFVEKALEQGAVCAIVSEEYQGDSSRVLYAKDVLSALGEIAKHYIRTLNVNIIAVSGSVGKTSTKEAIYAILSQRYKTFKTQGNFNSDIGLPLTLLSMKEPYDYAIIEMGMEKAGEIGYLADISNHKMAILTNIGTSHIASFGCKQGIFQEKMSIAKNFIAGDVLFVNGEDEFLKKVENKPYQVVRYGAKENEIYVKNITVSESKTSFTLVLGFKEYDLEIEALGVHQAKNIAGAASIAKYIGMKDEDILEGIKKIKNSNMRFEIFSKDGIMYIKDFYNSSYESLRNALESFKTISSLRKIAVVGNINECGDLLEEIHTDVGLLLNEYQLDEVCFVGDFMKHAFDVCKLNKKFFKEVPDVRTYLRESLKSGDAVMLKASRFMEFERILE